MKTLHTVLVTLLVIVCVAGIVFGIWASLTPSGIRTIETWRTGLKKASDDTNYETRKTVEDTCRSYIATYNTSVQMYNAYKSSADPAEKSMAEGYYQRAVQTANTYNDYILKNSFVWKNDIPADIYTTLTIPER